MCKWHAYDLAFSLEVMDHDREIAKYKLGLSVENSDLSYF